jgi:hypothetical protein
MVWDPRTKLVSPQCDVMFDNNFDTVHAPDPNIQITDTMDRLFKTNKYKYDDLFGNEHSCIFSYGGVDIHPESLSPNIKTCQESITMTSTCDEKHSATSNASSDKNTNNNRSILSMHDIIILHANNIFPQKIAKTTLQHIHTYTALTCKYSLFQNQAQDMGLSYLHE